MASCPKDFGQTSALWSQSIREQGMPAVEGGSSGVGAWRFRGPAADQALILAGQVCGRFSHLHITPEAGWKRTAGATSRNGCKGFTSGERCDSPCN